MTRKETMVNEECLPTDTPEKHYSTRTPPAKKPAAAFKSKPPRSWAAASVCKLPLGLVVEGESAGTYVVAITVTGVPSRVVK